MKLTQLEARIVTLDKLSNEVFVLAQNMSQLQDVQPELSIKGESWIRGARELLVQIKFSGLKDFDDCYKKYSTIFNKQERDFSDIESYINRGTSNTNKFKNFAEAQEYFDRFKECFLKSKSLLASALEEMKSRELPIKTLLSYSVSSDELITAEELLNSSTEETIIRASGVVARVALERYLFTVV